MEELFRLPTAVRRDSRVDTWFTAPNHEMRRLAEPWFERIRALGPGVAETMNDGHPVACVGDAAFAYVDAFGAHACVGFFHGLALEDPTGMLEGSGVRMRHVKLRWGKSVDEAALAALVDASYRDIRARLAGSELRHSDDDLG